MCVWGETENWKKGGGGLHKTVPIGSFGDPNFVIFTVYVFQIISYVALSI